MEIIPLQEPDHLNLIKTASRWASNAFQLYIHVYTVYICIYMYIYVYLCQELVQRVNNTQHNGGHKTQALIRSNTADNGGLESRVAQC